MRKNLLCPFGVAGCLALTLVWAMLALSGGALADPPGDGGHNHGGGGGGGGGGEETIFFDVRTLDLDGGEDPPVPSDIVIIGFFDSDGTSTTPEGCKYFPGPAAGRADKSQVIMNRPSPAIQMDFLAAGPDALSCFRAGDIYDLGCQSTMVIKQANNGSASIIFFFGAAGINGDVQSYRVDGDAMIVADDDDCGDGSFPKGACGYTVTVYNLSVSKDTGPRSNACEGSFPDAMAVIRLDRIQ